MRRSGVNSYKKKHGRGRPCHGCNNSKGGECPPYFVNSSQYLLKFSQHLPTLFAKSVPCEVSYSMKNTGLLVGCCAASASMIPLASTLPMPQGTSAFFSSMSFKCSSMIRPLSCLMQSTGTRPERSQWPVSEHEPMRFDRPSDTFSTVSGFQ